MNRLTSRLAAHAATRQVEASLRADRAADRAEAAVRGVWAQALRLLRGGGANNSSRSISQINYSAALTLFRGLLPGVVGETAAALARQASWGWRTARDNLRAVLPRRYVAAALREGRHGPVSHLPDQRADGAERRPAGGQRPGRLADLREDDSAGGAPTLDWSDLLAPLRSGADADLFDLIFPPPSPEQVDAVVYAGDWRARLASGTRLATPERLASALAAGAAAGKSHREVAKDLLPLVDGVRSTARRVARTEGLRVANAAQMACHAQLGDMIQGYMIHSTHGPHSRSWHQLRSGTVYYRDPRPGQKGYAQMPNPPDEAEDPAERPPGTPQLAHNCLCYLTPVLTPLEGDSHGGATADLEPDPAVFSDWFAVADDRRRSVAVGARRYRAARLAGDPGDRPGWEAFIDPSTGRLLSAAELKAESPTARGERVAKVRALIARRREDVRRAARLGYV